MEQQADYITETKEAIEMLGKGYPSLVIEPERTVLERRNGEFQEVVIPAFVKISTAFKAELASLDSKSIKVWLYIALSVNRSTGTANPGLRTIAKNTGFGVNTVQDCLKELETAGLLRVDRQSRKYNIYEPTQYVSANHSDPVSNTDTDRQTVSEKSETVSEKAKSVSVSQILNQSNQKNQSHPKFSDKTTETRKRMLMISETITYSIGITPDLTNRNWEKVLRTLVEFDEKGQKFETFAAWLKSGNEYNRPKPFQIARDPRIITTNWQQAFIETSDTTPKYSIPDYSESVPNPFAKARVNA